MLHNWEFNKCWCQSQKTFIAGTVCQNWIRGAGSRRNVRPCHMHQRTENCFQVWLESGDGSGTFCSQRERERERERERVPDSWCHGAECLGLEIDPWVYLSIILTVELHLALNFLVLQMWNIVYIIICIRHVSLFSVFNVVLIVLIDCCGLLWLKLPILGSRVNASNSCYWWNFVCLCDGGSAEDKLVWSWNHTSCHCWGSCGHWTAIRFISITSVHIYTVCSSVKHLTCCWLCVKAFHFMCQTGLLCASC